MDERIRSDKQKPTFVAQNAAGKSEAPALSKAPSEETGQRDIRKDPARSARAMDDRPATQSREATDIERIELFRSQFTQGTLPNLPAIPGYHMIWLSTNATNPMDTIPFRLRLGYTPVKPEDVPGWEYATLKTGEHAGYIGVNEMLAFKLPEELYQQYMLEAHFHAPNREDDKLIALADKVKHEAERDGVRIEEGDGIEELRSRATRAPVFT